MAKSAASSRLASIHSRILNEVGQPIQPPPRQQAEPKLLDVSITILSLSGFRATEAKNRKSMAKVLEQIRSTGSDNDMNAVDPAKMVASFAIDGAETTHGSKRTPMKHLPSLSFQLPSPFNANSTFSDIVSWPEHAAHSFWKEQAQEFANMSSFQFQRKFLPEVGTSRFQPHVCPIQISVARNGNLYKLGVASVFVNGEEMGESSTVVPIAIDERLFSGSNPQFDEAGSVPMVTLKGDTMKCGLDKPSIRVVVKVSYPKTRTNINQTSVSEERCCDQTSVKEQKKESTVFGMFSGISISRDRSEALTTQTASTGNSSTLSSILDSQEPYSVDEEDLSLYSETNSSIKKLKDELRNGGFLLPSAARQKLMSPSSLDESASASPEGGFVDTIFSMTRRKDAVSVDDTTISSASSNTAANSISEMVSSLKDKFPHSKARRWGNKLFACSGAPICACRDTKNGGSDLLSVVDEESVFTDKYSLNSRDV